jgi:hypothetical protein
LIDVGERKRREFLMAVFFDTGGGDIYGGPTKEAVIAAMQADSDEVDLEDIFEVSGAQKMRASDWTENDVPTEELITLDAAYDETLGSYMVASENC